MEKERNSQLKLENLTAVSVTDRTTKQKNQ